MSSLYYYFVLFARLMGGQDMVLWQMCVLGCVLLIEEVNSHRIVFFFWGGGGGGRVMFSVFYIDRYFILPLGIKFCWSIKLCYYLVRNQLIIIGVGIFCLFISLLFTVFYLVIVKLVPTLPIFQFNLWYNILHGPKMSNYQWKGFDVGKVFVIDMF